MKAPSRRQNARRAKIPENITNQQIWIFKNVAMAAGRFKTHAETDTIRRVIPLKKIILIIQAGTPKVRPPGGGMANLCCLMDRRAHHK
jgi:hypothetical protein